MDRNEIIARLRHMVRIGDAMNACRTESNNVLAAAADLLESDEWVSVDERLPEPRQDVLVAAYFDDGDFAVVTAYMEPEVGWISVDGGNDLDEVAHWRPLPNPPGGDHG